MRTLLSSLVLIGATALPRLSTACDYIAQFVSGTPVGGAIVPTNAQAFAWAPFMGRSPMHAELVDPRGFAPIPVDVRSLGDDVVQLELPPLDPSINYTAQVWMDNVEDASFDFSFVPGRSPDTDPPPSPTAMWNGHQGPANSCESFGFYIDVEIGRVAEDDVLLYEILELLPNDGIVSVGAAFVSDAADVTQYISAFVGNQPLNDRCFYVASVDQAGNRSLSRDLHCFTAVPMDGGVPPPWDAGPPIDAGSMSDAGSVAPDATANPDASQPAVDAGTPALTGEGLNSSKAGCGCQGHRGAGRGSVGLLFGLGLLGLLRRRRPAL